MANKEEYVLKRLMAYGMVKGSTPEIQRRIGWAVAWAAKGSRIERPKVRVTRKTAKAIEEFARSVSAMADPAVIQNAAFEALKRNGLKPSEFFPTIYGILLGSDRGPRLGPYVIDAGPSSVSEALLRAVGSK